MEKIMQVIEAHNKMVDVIGNTKAEVGIMAGLSIWDSIAMEGYAILELAKEYGIKAKITMTNGKIFVEKI